MGIRLIENKKIIENNLSFQDYNIIKIQVNQIQCSRLMNETNVRICVHSSIQI